LVKQISHNFAFPADLCEYHGDIRTTSRVPLTYSNPMAIFAQLPASLSLMRIPMPYSQNFPCPSDFCESHDHVRGTSQFQLTGASPGSIRSHHRGSTRHA